METTLHAKEITAPAPTGEKERIVILDSLRGFAILGILLMNISAFGLSHDTFALNETGLNFKIWHWVLLLPDGTQRALFSMLFGAGIILFVSSAEKKSDGLQPADYFFRRQLWLMAFSLFDVFVLLWYGDILMDYALYGMLMFAFRGLSARKLLYAAGICLVLMTARENRDLYKQKSVIDRGEAVALLDTTKVKLTTKQKAQLSALKELKEGSRPAKRLEEIKTEIEKTGTGTYEDLYDHRTAQYVQSMIHYMFFQAWDVLLFMFTGMAFFKLGILTGQAPIRVYWWMFGVGFGLGLLLSYYWVQPLIDYRLNRYEVLKNVHFEFYQIQRVFRSLGIFAGLILLFRSGWFNWLFAIMRPVGQMAFTNYLTQSLICGIIFYSIGFAKFGKLERIEIYYVVVAIWLFQIVASNVWLRFFRFGPFEWLWRCLTYWRIWEFKRS